MTEKLSIGNVSFREKDVKSYAVKFEGGKKINTVFLKNGTKLTFKDQEGTGRKMVLTHIRHFNSETYKASCFFGIQGLEVEGSEHQDFYALYNCDSYNVDTRGG